MSWNNLENQLDRVGSILFSVSPKTAEQREELTAMNRLADNIGHAIDMGKDPTIELGVVWSEGEEIFSDLTIHRIKNEIDELKTRTQQLMREAPPAQIRLLWEDLESAGGKKYRLIGELYVGECGSTSVRLPSGSVWLIGGGGMIRSFHLENEEGILIQLQEKDFPEDGIGVEEVATLVGEGDMYS